MWRSRNTPFSLLVLALLPGVLCARQTEQPRSNEAMQQRVWQSSQTNMRPANQPATMILLTREEAAALGLTPSVNRTQPEVSRRPVARFPWMGRSAAEQSPQLRRFDPGSAKVMKPSSQGFRTPRKSSGLFSRRR